MTFDMGTLFGLLFETIRRPKAGADAVMVLRLGRDVLWQLLALVTVLSVLAAQITVLVLDSNDDEVLASSLLSNPLLAALIQAVMLLAIVYAIYAIGRAFGGTASFDDVLVLVVWLQFILLVIQMVQSIALFVFPALGLLIGLASVALFGWLLVNFVAHVHGFRSLGLVFAGILVSGFAIAFLLSLLLAMLGIVVPVTQ